MSKPTTQPIGYGILEHGIWTLFCPPCWGKMFGLWREADAELHDGNGDIVTCDGCCGDIK